MKDEKYLSTKRCILALPQSLAMLDQHYCAGSEIHKLNTALHQEKNLLTGSNEINLNTKLASLASHAPPLLPYPFA
jgi:hypothetical protein